MDTSKKVVLITGANSGLGFSISKALAKKDLQIIMACRNIEKAERARKEILREVSDADLNVLQLDVSEISSIREFVHEFSSTVGAVDILINNAGIVASELMRNNDGHELQLATHFFGPYSLTGMMLPFFRKDAQTRIVNVGSLAHRMGKFSFEDPNWNQAPFNNWKAYAKSKIALVAFTMELNRRLQASNSSTIALGAHPGFANTEGGNKYGATTPKTALSKWFQEQMKAWVVPACDQASEPILHAACSAEVKGGEYFGPSGLFEIKGPTGKAKLHPQANSVEFGKRLWSMSESITGIQYLSSF